VLSLRAQQRLDRTAFIHGAITLGCLMEEQGQVEGFARVDLPALDKVNQLTATPCRELMNISRSSNSLFFILPPSYQSVLSSL
jgi:hypothetical protein